MNRPNSRDLERLSDEIGRVLETVDVRIPDAAFPPKVEDSKIHQLWLGITRDLVGRSATARRTKASAVLAEREGRIVAAAVDGFPPCVDNSVARQRDPAYWNGMHLNAEAALVCHAALHGTSLRGSTVYCWPMLNSVNDASLLIAAGVAVIVEPDYHVPMSREADRLLIRSMTFEAGVLLVREAFDAILGAHHETCGEHSSDLSNAPAHSPNQP